MEEIEGLDAKDLSASSTLIVFDRPMPLLRVPLLAAASENPSAGPFLLAFRSVESWKSAFRSTEAKIFEQCQAGARISCSISASKKCSPPWWKILLGLGRVDFLERERCEERETAACLEASKGPCSRFAKEKCLPAFGGARIDNPNFIHDDRATFMGSDLLEEIFREGD